jgi:drug/metabolite transporter (DMT)-like permease
VVTLLLMVVGVLAVSVSAPLVAAMTVPALAVAFWRTGIATALTAPAAWHRRSDWAEEGGSTALLVVVSGAALALHFATWLSSLRLTSVASATAIGSLQLVWVVLWERSRGHRFRLLVSLGVTVALIGVLVVSGVDLTTSSRALLGDLLALVGGLAVSVYMVLGARVRRRLSTASYTFGCYGTCAGLLLVTCLVAGQPLAGYPAQQWALLLALTVSAQLLGHSVFNHLLATQSPTLVALVLLLEVPGASIIAAAFLRQIPAAGALLGLALILGGMVMVIRGGGAQVEAVVEDPAR